jgi:hypothetical protein
VQLRAESIDGGPLDLWRNDLKHGWQAQRFVENGLPYVGPNSVIFSDWEQATPLWYAQALDGVRPDVEIRFQLQRLTPAIVGRRPTYLSRTLPTLGDAYRYTADGTLIRLLDRPNTALPNDVTRVDVEWNGELQLAGFRLYQTDLSRGRLLPLSLYFRALAKPSVDYAISVRLFDGAGRQVAQEDRDALALGMYKTSRWEQGEVVGDYLELIFPPEAQPGRYRVGVLVYSKAADGSFINYRLPPGDALFHLLPEIRIGL